jgi:IS30 family transposase
VSSTPAPHSDERHLTLGDYTADIVISKREEHCFYSVIKRAGSAEIIEMQRFKNPSNAEVAAKDALKRWNQESDSRRVAT